MSPAFRKNERLCSRQIIDKLFSGGKSVKQFPFHLVWYSGPEVIHPFQIAISVPRRCIHRAVRRNKVKRKMREAFRLHKNEWLASLKHPTAAMLVYLDSKDRPLEEMERKICLLFERFKEEEQGKRKK